MERLRLLKYRPEKNVVRAGLVTALALATALIPCCSKQDEMVVVPAGKFLMGSDPAEDGDSTPDEWPLREVLVDEFRIDRLEVTLAQYQQCVEAGACPETPRELHNIPSTSCSWGRPDKADHPVNCITWQQAATFCAWKGKRLPTEIEWEKAARGADARLYPWGNEWTDGRANVGDGRFTERVGSYPDGASPYGMQDAVGNVMEWTLDSYEEGNNPGTSDRRPAGVNKVVRGGGFGTGAWGRRLAYRDWYGPDHRDARIGFRCARDGSIPKDMPVARVTIVGTEASAGHVEVQEGLVRLGCDPNKFDDCRPGEAGRTVKIGPFEMDRTEVSVAEYLKCAQAGRCTSPDSGKYCNYGKADRLDHPVNCVDHIQAEAYCSFAGGRLPTADEWEAAARGRDGRRFPWGDDEPTCELACTGIGGSGCGRDRTFRVGSSPRGASPAGALDMAGNVWEWTSTRTETGQDIYITKGGAWDDRDGLPSCRFRARTRESRVDNLGFRCAYDAD